MHWCSAILHLWFQQSLSKSSLISSTVSALTTFYKSLIRSATKHIVNNHIWLLFVCTFKETEVWYFVKYESSRSWYFKLTYPSSLQINRPKYTCCCIMECIIFKLSVVFAHLNQTELWHRFCNSYQPCCCASHHQSHSVRTLYNMQNHKQP